LFKRIVVGIIEVETVKEKTMTVLGFVFVLYFFVYKVLAKTGICLLAQINSPVLGGKRKKQKGMRIKAERINEGLNVRK
jgi:hypothetical protein